MYGYAGKVLRVDLTAGTCGVDQLDESTARKWVGGSGLGTQYLLEEVPAGTKWSDPENLLVITSGPLGGSGASGGCSINVAGLGPMTGGAGISQANGFMGAYLKFSGFDGIVLQGASPKLVYLVIKDGQAEIKDAAHLAGKMMLETEDIIRKDLRAKERDVSVFGIGPAGENLVYFASVMGDRGHAAGHNGLGAIMGSKKCKAIVAHKGPRNFELYDPETFKAVNRQMFADAKGFEDGIIYNHGTGGGFAHKLEVGELHIGRNIEVLRSRKSDRYVLIKGANRACLPVR